MKWEYQHTLMAVISGAYTAFDEMGAEGWELVAVVSVDKRPEDHRQLRARVLETAEGLVLLLD